MEKNVKGTPRKGPRIGVSFKGEHGRSRTKQSFASGTKVDAILKRYATLGPESALAGIFQQHVATMPFGIGETTYDYQAQLNRAIEVQTYFRALPSELRGKFGHNPGNMLAFMADPRNRKECEELGLLEAVTPAPEQKPASGGESAAPAKGEPEAKKGEAKPS